MVVAVKRVIEQKPTMGGRAREKSNFQGPIIRSIAFSKGCHKY